MQTVKCYDCYKTFEVKDEELSKTYNYCDECKDKIKIEKEERKKEIKKKIIESRPLYFRNKSFDDFNFTGKEKEIQNMPANSSFLIAGNVGTGKTHLLYAFANKYFIYSRAILFGDMLFKKLKTEMLDNNDSFIKNLCTQDLLLLDDIGAVKLSDFDKGNLFTIVNTRYMNCLPIILTTNLTLKDLEEALGERVLSRLLEMCKVFKLTGKDGRLL